MLLLLLMLLLTSSLSSYALHRLAFVIQGEINIKDRHIWMPFSPPEIPLFHQHNKKMAYVYVTDYLLNSGFMAAFKNQQLSGYVNESLVSVVEATGCFHHCLLCTDHRLLLLEYRPSPPASRLSFIVSRFLCIVHFFLILPSVLHHVLFCRRFNNFRLLLQTCLPHLLYQRLFQLLFLSLPFILSILVHCHRH